MNPSDRYMVISSDCHAGADVHAYKPYLEETWHDDFELWARSFSNPWDDIVGDSHTHDDLNIGIANLESTLNWDSARRTELLEGDGIVAEVLFPNTAPPFFPAGVFAACVPRTTEEYVRRLAGIRAHNRWMEDFCADLPGRRAGLAQVFLNDIEDAVAEVRRAKSGGLRGVLLPPDNVISVPLYYPRYDALWQVCEELEMPVHRHASLPLDSPSEENGDACAIANIYEQHFFTQRGLGHLIFAGVFERFPNLKFVITEGGAGWIVNYLKELDGLLQYAKQDGSMVKMLAYDAASRLTRMPSEYFQTNCYLGASLITAAECGMRSEIGVDKIMWGSDLPHLEGTHPFTQEALRAVFAGVSPDEVQRMVGSTAAEVYGFDAGLLQPIADKIGPTVQSVATPLTDWPKPGETVHPALAPEAIPGYGNEVQAGAR